MKFILVIIAVLVSSNVMAFESKYSTTLKHVTSIGEWKHKNQTGYFRFISHATGSEHVISKLYVQWLTHHIDGEQDSKIVAEIEIVELRGFEYSVPKCNKTNECKIFSLKATESFSHFKSFLFTIIVSKFGEYTLEKKPL